MNKHIHEIDSLRGLAALSVLIYHILLVLPPLPNFLSYSPLRIIWSGHEAVILFFILSGFVLSLPFNNNKNIYYSEFIIKRIFRIYTPYLIAVLFTLLLKSLFYTKSVEEIGWANSFWTITFDNNNLLNHILLIPNFNTDVLDPVTWSLVHEMRISIIFPLLMVIVNKFDWIKTLGIAVLFSITGMIFNTLHITVSEGFLTSYGYTIHYISMFLIGSLFAKHKEKIVTAFKGMINLKRFGIILLGFCSYTFQNIFGIYFNNSALPYIQEWFIAFGACTFILVSLTSIRFSKILLAKQAIFLGKVSYSLYLFHFPVLLACLYSLNDILPRMVIIIVSILATFCISTISWLFIENNSVKFGKSLIKRMVNRTELKQIKYNDFKRKSS